MEGPSRSCRRTEADAMSNTTTISSVFPTARRVAFGLNASAVAIRSTGNTAIRSPVRARVPLAPASDPIARSSGAEEHRTRAGPPRAMRARFRCVAVLDDAHDLRKHSRIATLVVSQRDDHRRVRAERRPPDVASQRDPIDFACRGDVEHAHERIIGPDRQRLPVGREHHSRAVVVLRLSSGVRQPRAFARQHVARPPQRFEPRHGVRPSQRFDGQEGRDGPVHLTAAHEHGIGGQLPGERQVPFLCGAIVEIQRHQPAGR